MYHPKEDINHVYFPMSNGDRCMIQLALSYKMSTMVFHKYLEAIQDWMLQLTLQHEKSKTKLYSVSKETHNNAKQSRTQIEDSTEVNTTDRKSTRKLKQETRKLGQKQTEESWSQKTVPSKQKY